MIRLCTPAIAGIALFGSISVLPAESPHEATEFARDDHAM
jgi:hypothetical protein